MTAVEASAPARIDLAGGTLDIPPLDLLVPNAITLNAAVDLRARARAEPRPAGVLIRSVDRGIELELGPQDDLRADRRLPLLSGLVAHFHPGGGVALETDCASPAGAGLGGSSALAVAAAAALAALAGREAPAGELLHVARDVETRVLRVPTGVQDYLAALHGGALAIRFGVGGWRQEALACDLDALERRAVLIYTGEPRSSGINNWEVLKRYLDGDPEVAERLEGIARQAERAAAALARGDLEELAQAVDAEWDERRRLAPGVSTSAIERLMEAARAAGAQAGKVCGAGGGGCVLLLAADGKRRDVERAAQASGMRLLPFRFDRSGVTVGEPGAGEGRNHGKRR